MIMGVIVNLNHRDCVWLCIFQDASKQRFYFCEFEYKM